MGNNIYFILFWLILTITTLDQVTPAENNEAMDIDEPSTGDSTPAPGASTLPTGSSSNAEMTPPVRSIKLKLKVKNTKVASPPPERPAGRGRGRGREGKMLLGGVWQEARRGGLDFNRLVVSAAKQHNLSVGSSVAGPGPAHIWHTAAI